MNESKHVARQAPQTHHGRRNLPPYGERIQGDGVVFCALAWRLANGRQAFVIPPGRKAREYNLRFLRGRQVTVLHPLDHPAERIEEAVAALQKIGADVHAIPMMRLVK